MTSRAGAVRPPCCRAARRASDGCAGSAGISGKRNWSACRPVTISPSISHTGASLYASRRAVTSRSRVVPFSSYAAQQLDVAPDVLVEQAIGIEQVELVVLLEHTQARRFGQGADVHRCGIDGGRDIEEPQVRHACQAASPAGRRARGRRSSCRRSPRDRPGPRAWQSGPSSRHRTQWRFPPCVLRALQQRRP